MPYGWKGNRRIGCMCITDLSDLFSSMGSMGDKHFIDTPLLRGAPSKTDIFVGHGANCPLKFRKLLSTASVAV